MKYFKLNAKGTKWIESKEDKKSSQINLYDYINGNMIFKGIGQY